MKTLLRVIFFVALLSFIQVTQSTGEVDPWVLEQRMDLYKALLNVTADPTMFGADNLGNVLWGLPLQLQWQNNSGRLRFDKKIPNTRISAKSWWADINYYLSVGPYLGGVKAGVLPKVTLLPPEDSQADKFCLTYETCDQQVMTAWADYFDTVRDIKKGIVTMSLDDLLGIMWTAHTSSLQYACSIFTEELKDLPSPQETQLGNGWAHFVEIIAAARFVTNYTEVSSMGIDLPPKVLTLFDIPGFIPGFTSSQNLFVESMISVSDLSKTPAWDVFLDAWKEAMKNPNCRIAAQRTLNDFFQHPGAEVLLLLEQLLTGCSLDN